MTGVCLLLGLLLGPARAADLSPEFAAMNQPMAPFRLSDEIYYVGARDVTAFLIVTHDGLILTDGGFAQTAPQIEANIRTLGFDIRNVKLLLSSHAHFDHAGGLAALKTASGAMLLASAADKPALENGGGGDFPPVKVDRILADGAQTKLGDTVITMHLTPGHTRGCTSWSMTTHVGGKPVPVLFVCSLSVLPSYHLLSPQTYPGIAADYAASIAKLRRLPCGMLLVAHGSFFGLLPKRAAMIAHPGSNPFVDPNTCRMYLDGADAAYRQALARELAQQKRAR